jgi:hypothetical protein
VSRLAVVPELEKELDHLYVLPPAEFTAARNTLARRLKDTGQREAAARVQALRKPTVPVWVINQLARRHSEQVEALVAAADELRQAQEAALKEGAQERLRKATADERDAVRALTHGTQEILSERPAAAVLDRIASTLRAAALDPDIRDLLAAGRLNEELEPAGFGGLGGIEVPAAPKRPQKRAPARPTEERRRKERLRKLRERADKLAAAAAEAEREAERAESEAVRERRKADRARAAADRARDELAALSD